MRNLIKKLLREFEFKEADDTSHSKRRYNNRVINIKSYKTTNVPDKLSFTEYENVKYIVELIRKVNFPEGVEFAVKLATSPMRDERRPKDFDYAKGFLYKQRGEEDSWGNFLWLVVKNNKIVTITIHREKLKNNGRMYPEVKPEILKKYLKHFKGYEIPDTISELKQMEPMDLTDKSDYLEMQNTSYAPMSSTEKEIDVNNKKYIINLSDKTFYPKFKPSEKKKINTFVDFILGMEKPPEHEYDLAKYLYEYI